MRFGLERSGTDIYDRIVLELADGLRQCGHECVLVQPQSIKSLDDLMRAYGPCDWVVVTNNGGWLTQSPGDTYLFETLPLPIVFLHHDALSHSSLGLAGIAAKIEALIRIRDRSVHFSIESGDVSALRSLGLRAHDIPHINTLGRTPHPVGLSDTTPGPDVSFIGHAVPAQHGIFEFGLDDAEFHAAYLARLRHFGHDVRRQFAERIGKSPSDDAMTVDELARRTQHIQCCHAYSAFLRGEVISALGDWTVDLYGGDPAWIHGAEQTRMFPQPHVRHHKPVFDPSQVSGIFRTSGVNLNITSMQFDTALINRVIDCTAAGGFMLTDTKAQLFELTECASAIVYESLDDLKAKIAYFVDPAHQAEKEAIVRQLQSDFEKHCSIRACVERLVSTLAKPRVTTVLPELTR